MSSLKQSVWEAHPTLPRQNKLKMLKYLPVLTGRLEAIHSSLGLPEPDHYDIINSSIENDVLTLRGSANQTIGSLYVGSSPDVLNTVTLANGKIIGEHEFHLLTDAHEDAAGSIPGCVCSQCAGITDTSNQELAEQVAGQFEEREFHLDIHPSTKVANLSSKVLERVKDSPYAPPVPIVPLQIIKISRSTLDDD